MEVYNMFLLGILGIIILVGLIVFFVGINSKQYRDKLPINGFNLPKKKRLMIFIATLVIVSLSVYLANYYLLIRINLRYYGIIFYGFIFILLMTNIIFMYLNTDTKKKTRINGLIAFSFVG